MKKRYILLSAALLLNIFPVFAQTTTGLIAHWDMNGTPNDVTGHGHNGHANNVTPSVGKDGVMGHAYYFNGSNSVITVPYSPAFNINSYTIVARVNVKGFNADPCHNNTIFLRGQTSGGATGGDWYGLYFSDYPAGYGCTPTIDSSQETFLPAAYSATGALTPGSHAPFYYTPPIVKNVWYTVVATFNDTVYKVYINNVLKVTVPILTPGVPIGTGTDSIYIGLNLMEESAGYPYPFKGDIDDIMLYNRALDSSEVSTLPLGIQAVNTGSTISVFPNPAHSQITIAGADRITNVVITNLMGQVVYNQEHKDEQVSINIENLPNGVYLVRINNTDIRKFIKE